MAHWEWLAWSISLETLIWILLKSFLLISMLISDTPLGTSLSTGLSENYQCMLVWKLIDYFLVYCSKYYCLNIIVSINSTSTRNITMNTILNIPWVRFLFLRMKSLRILTEKQYLQIKLEPTLKVWVPKFSNFTCKNQYFRSYLWS